MEFSPPIGHGTGTSSGAGTSSAARYNKDQAVHEFPVVDLADAMFNCGSSSTSNNMDFLFPNSVEDKHDIKGTKKNGWLIKIVLVINVVVKLTDNLME